MKRLDSQETRDALQSYGLDRPRGVGFAFLDRAQHVFYDWHTHDYHQLIYAMDRTTQIETENGRYVLPAGRAAWIPAMTHHRTQITDGRVVSLFFSPDIVADPTPRVRIVVASALMREMMVYATRWPLGAAERDPVAASFLQTLALLCQDWLEAELPLHLPAARHPGIVRAIDYALANMATVTQAQAIAVAAMSERSFRRIFMQETGMNWQDWLGQARILTAAGLLEQKLRITDVAAAVGYASLSAFAAAFTKLVGEAPARFRARR